MQLVLSALLSENSELNS